ncbi:glycosyltransferase family 2 protein [Shewanella sp. C32]|uniref:Glycosyltransferase family 2 protein n=1 Tax=Shewanella electrica TaxID=515560 RepID=A0ABT2FJK4_9GAMM|nr:glycosyltransferase family 2 protein [Shewanella electrica]MCH1924611.1 glycosyltransferase family 2 protein [Shewanella electrica]MCS4556512.1 glycosyltransferase family 2 protein [Shewanella electrica]
MTIAIPTYNRLKFLSQTIDALLPQILARPNAEIELLICDNASQDGTCEYLTTLSKAYSFVKVHNEDSNLGIDANIHNCSVFASGEYVFTLSDDDIPENDTISEIIDNIKNIKLAGDKPTFMFLNGYVFSGEYNSSLPKNDRIFLENSKDITFKDRNEFVSHIGVWATFVSSFVYNRECWLRAAEDKRFIGTDIYLAYVLYSMLRYCDKMIIISNPVIAIRAQYTGNYRILKAFCVEWNNLLNNVATTEWGYSKLGNRKIFSKTFFSNLINKVIDIKRSSYMIPRDDRVAVMLSLHNFPVERLVMRTLFFLNYHGVIIFNKIITILGIRTNNFLLGGKND